MDQLATFPLVALVNADIVLLDDFLPAVRSVSEQALRDFMLVASRYNCRIDTPLRFESGWDAALRARARSREPDVPGGRQRHLRLSAVDCSTEVPDLAIGRGYWDNWLMREHATQAGAPDRRDRAPHRVHQDHGYDHVPGMSADASDEPVYQSEEGRRNLALAGGHRGLYTVFDATHVLTADGRLRSTWGLSLAHRRLKASVRRVVRGLTVRD